MPVLLMAAVLAFTAVALTVAYALWMTAVLTVPPLRRAVPWPVVVGAGISALAAAVHVARAVSGASWWAWVWGGGWLLIGAAQYAAYLYVRHVDRRITDLRLADTAYVTGTRPPVRRTLEGPHR